MPNKPLGKETRMTKEINNALKEATKNLKELANAPRSKNVSLFQLTTITNDDKITINNLHYADDMTHLINAFTAVLNDNPKLAHLMGHAIAQLDDDSYDAFKDGFDVDEEEIENNLISTIAFLRASKNMTNEDYFKELENMKKELANMDMSEDDIKTYIETFDQNVSKAMKNIKKGDV